MLARLRRASKNTAPAACSDGLASNPLATPTATTKTTFFSLPAELRNVIYELVAEPTILRISNQRPTKFAKKKSTPIPSLLIVSQQCRSEYLPVLLSSALIELSVIDFDFSNIVRISGSLYSTELRALRHNQRLMIVLAFTLRPSSSGMQTNLRRWATHRSAALDRLPWQYRLVEDPQHSAVGMMVFGRCMGNLQVLHSKVDEALQWEVQAIMDAIALKHRKGLLEEIYPLPGEA